VIALGGLFFAVCILLSTTVNRSSFAVVPLEMPVLSAPIHDNSVAGFKEAPNKSLEKATLTVALTPTEFIFGDITAFTSAKDDIRARYLVPHLDGSPQVDTLLSQIASWQEFRERKYGVRGDRLFVLIPDSRLPMTIVIKVIDLVRMSGKFDRVLLAGGIH
jgi:hypothetical protein